MSHSAACDSHNRCERALASSGLRFATEQHSLGDVNDMGRFHGDSAQGDYRLPNGWQSADPALLESAHGHALSAWDGQEVDRVSDYYDPDSDYAGSLLTEVPVLDEEVLRALPIQDYITESKTISYILFMVFC
jgi:hypothetical protein